MNNKDYVTLVNAGNFPEDIKVPIDPPFSDERGDITNLWLGNSGSVTLITSKAGSKRANHHHVNDWHSSYVVSGSIIYTEADVDKSNMKEYTFKAGDQFFSPPNKWHSMYFPEDTVFVTMNGIVKDHVGYEASVVRSK